MTHAAVAAILLTVGVLGLLALFSAAISGKIEPEGFAGNFAFGLMLLLLGVCVSVGTFLALGYLG